MRSGNRRRFMAGMLASVALAMGSASAMAEDAASYPSRPVTIVVAKSPGGIDDTVGRLVAAYLQPELGQPVVVENKAGASGIIGTQHVIRSKPDGYTILLINLASQVVVGVQQDTPPYDPVADFNPVSLVATYRNVLLTSTGIPAPTLADFVAYAKERPGELTFGSGGLGSMNQMAIELLMREHGLDMVHVPYKGGGDAVLALNSGQIQIYYTDVNSALSAQKMGNSVLIGQTGDTRSELMPDVPLMSEAGMPILAKSRAIGLIAPPGTPEEILDKLHAAVQKALANPEMAERAASIGVDLAPAPRSAFADYIKSDVETWVPVAMELKAQ